MHRQLPHLRSLYLIIHYLSDPEQLINNFKVLNITMCPMHCLGFAVAQGRELHQELEGAGHTHIHI